MEIWRQGEVEKWRSTSMKIWRYDDMKIWILGRKGYGEKCEDEEEVEYEEEAMEIRCEERPYQL
jgi:hypothetical protein